MPYYDQDGRPLSGRNDRSARGEWIYTEDGGKVRAEASRQRDIDIAAAHQRSMTRSAAPRHDEATFVMWGFKMLLFTLPLKAIQLALWSTGVGWRCGRWSYRVADRRLQSHGMRPWLGATFAALGATVTFATVTVGLVAYALAGVVALLKMDSTLLTLWASPLLALLAVRIVWRAWQAVRSP